MATQGPKGSGELVNCSLCGRDTRAVSGICYRCIGPNSYYGYHDEEKGRRARSSQVLGGTPIRDADPEEDPTHPRTVEVYHGPSIRDDL